MSVRCFVGHPFGVPETGGTVYTPQFSAVSDGALALVLSEELERPRPGEAALVTL